jgi:hypothetical protein
LFAIHGVENHVWFSWTRDIYGKVFYIIEVDFEGEALGTELANERFPF